MIHGRSLPAGRAIFNPHFWPPSFPSVASIPSFPSFREPGGAISNLDFTPPRGDIAGIFDPNFR
jgi:hypothetical protein